MTSKCYNIHVISIQQKIFEGKRKYGQMIRTNIVLTDDFTGEAGTFTAKDKAELLQVMEQNNIEKCNVDFTFAGMDGLTTTIYRAQLENELNNQQKGAD